MIGKLLLINHLEVEYNGEIIPVQENMFDTGTSLIKFNFKGIEVKKSIDEDDSAYHVALSYIKLIDYNTIEDVEQYLKCEEFIRNLKLNYIIIDNEVYEPYYKCIEKKVHIAIMRTKTMPLEVSSDILSEFPWKRLGSKKEVFGELNRLANHHFNQTGEKPIEEYLLKQETEDYQNAITHINEVKSRVK